MQRTDDRTVANILCGACCGAAATVPMTVAMVLIQRLLPRASREPQEPQQIVDTLLDKAAPLDRVAPGVAPAERHRYLAALLAHFGYGTATGAIYPIVDRTLRQYAFRGPAFGIALYAASYAGWLPALKILPPPQDRPTGRNGLLVAAHLVWGAALQHLYSAQPAQRRPA